MNVSAMTAMCIARVNVLKKRGSKQTNTIVENGRLRYLENNPLILTVAEENAKAMNLAKFPNALKIVLRIIKDAKMTHAVETIKSARRKLVPFKSIAYIQGHCV